MPVMEISQKLKDQSVGLEEVKKTKESFRNSFIIKSSNKFVF